MVRVLKPGALGVFVEGDLRVAQLLTSDDRLRMVFDAKSKHIYNMISNPHAATDAYKYLLSHPSAENVTINTWTDIISPMEMDPGFAMERQMLGMLVKNGTVSQEDVDYYIEQVPKAVAAGDFVMPIFIFEVGCTKKAGGDAK
eukprot:gene5458-7675_t